MSTVSLTLKHGLKIGDDVLQEVTLRELTAGDVIAAQGEAEKLVMVPGKAGPTPQLVASPSQVSMHSLRRQIARIGNVDGPLDMHQLGKLHPDDLALLMAKADELESALAADVDEQVQTRGRDIGVGQSG